MFSLKSSVKYRWKAMPIDFTIKIHWKQGNIWVIRYNLCYISHKRNVRALQGCLNSKNQEFQTFL